MLDRLVTERYARTRELEASFQAHLSAFGHRADLVSQALELMYRVHFGQAERPDGQPYINHPLSVALGVMNLFETHDHNVVIAALLHDSVEDRPVQLLRILGHQSTDIGRGTAFQVLTRTFGARVSNLVQNVTNPIFDTNSVPAGANLKQVKREKYHDHVMAVFDEDQDAAMIKLADFSENALNLNSLPDGQRKHNLLKKYGPVLRSIITHLKGVEPNHPHTLYQHRAALIQRLTSVYDRDYAAS